MFAFPRSSKSRSVKIATFVLSAGSSTFFSSNAISLSIRRKIPSIRLAQRKRRHIVRIARIQVAKRPVVGRCQKQMAALVIRERVPVPVKQRREDLRLHLRLFLHVIPLLIARVLIRAGLSRRAALRIDRRRKQNVLPIRRPGHVIRLGADVRELMGLAHGPRGCIKRSQPDSAGSHPAR